MLPLTALLSLVPVLPLVAANPVHHSKRWNTCWGYNTEGCPFPDQGCQGAVATVSERMWEMCLQIGSRNMLRYRS